MHVRVSCQSHFEQIWVWITSCSSWVPLPCCWSLHFAHTLLPALGFGCSCHQRGGSRQGQTQIHVSPLLLLFSDIPPGPHKNSPAGPRWSCCAGQRSCCRPGCPVPRHAADGGWRGAGGRLTEALARSHASRLPAHRWLSASSGPACCGQRPQATSFPYLVVL